ncbi:MULTISPECIES: stage II sporulation protein M [unclassified Fusibacter]|uniref:stage II sporulation protein M n=1 Tax=unclassified Fusibacter TaxID=2624464 RepID=UPI0010104A26|nr:MULTISPECIES: stage II sporulation protein M [unclassified Fusibacter]MCK8058638.1 stage II sporulation protein M [Fusibacter sp. A2]NPE21713.1 stage II sporulation protein M [Fusibacter sp. A1]RXV61288.1 stage II sporulation protein M [Fusibacter sp. A1]
MTEEQFIMKHQATWKRLSELEKVFKHTKKSKIATKDADDFLMHYRDVSHDLAFARTHFPGSRTATYLNQLVASCHGLLYKRERITFKGLVHAVGTKFPYAHGKFGPQIVLAVVIFLIGATVAGVMTAINTQWAAFFLPQAFIDSVSRGELGGGDWNYPLMSSVIMTNNILVALKAFVFGILLGVGTVYVLFYNGAMLGALTILVYRFADPFVYWSLILPHGIIELHAIFISGAAGLLLARALLMPGLLKRSHAVIKVAKESMLLLLGVVLMLVLAGLIEGFITPLELSASLKYLFAFVTGMGSLFLSLRGIKLWKESGE